MSDKKLTHMIHDEMVTALEKNIDADMKLLFGSTVPAAGASMSNLSIEDLMKTAKLFENPRAAWQRDKEAC